MDYGSLIVLKKNGEEGSVHSMTKRECIIGRDTDCDIRVQQPMVSRQHCQLQVQPDGKALVWSLTPLNTPSLNGEPLSLHRKRPLLRHDEITVGTRRFRWTPGPSASPVVGSPHGDSTAAGKENSRPATPAAGSAKRSRSAGSLSLSRASRSKKVSFGPNLSPECFHRGLPAATPLKKGRKPVSQLLSVKESVAEDVANTPTKSLLKQRRSTAATRAGSSPAPSTVVVSDTASSCMTDEEFASAFEDTPVRSSRSAVESPASDRGSPVLRRSADRRASDMMLFESPASRRESFNSAVSQSPPSVVTPAKRVSKTPTKRASTTPVKRMSKTPTKRASKTPTKPVSKTPAEPESPEAVEAVLDCPSSAGRTPAKRLSRTRASKVGVAGVQSSKRVPIGMKTAKRFSLGVEVSKRTPVRSRAPKRTSLAAKGVELSSLSYVVSDKACSSKTATGFSQSSVDAAEMVTPIADSPGSPTVSRKTPIKSPKTAEKSPTKSSKVSVVDTPVANSPDSPMRASRKTPGKSPRTAEKLPTKSPKVSVVDTPVANSPDSPMRASRKTPIKSPRTAEKSPTKSSKVSVVDTPVANSPDSPMRASRKIGNKSPKTPTISPKGAEKTPITAIKPSKTPAKAATPVKMPTDCVESPTALGEAQSTPAAEVVKTPVKSVRSVKSTAKSAASGRLVLTARKSLRSTGKTPAGGRSAGRKRQPTYVDMLKQAMKGKQLKAGRTASVRAVTQLKRRRAGRTTSGVSQLELVTGDISLGSPTTGHANSPPTLVLHGKQRGRPKGTPGRPKASPGRPKASPGRPKASPGRPKASPGRPKASPGRPKASPGRPKGTPGRPKASPGRPKASPGRPKASPGRPKASPGRPKASPGRPKGTPGRPKASPGRPKATPLKTTAKPRRATTTPGLQDSVWDAVTPDVSLGVFVSPMTSTTKKPRLLTPGRIRSLLDRTAGSDADDQVTDGSSVSSELASEVSAATSKTPRGSMSAKLVAARGKAALSSRKAAKSVGKTPKSAMRKRQPTYASMLKQTMKGRQLKYGRKSSVKPVPKKPTAGSRATRRVSIATELISGDISLGSPTTGHANSPPTLVLHGKQRQQRRRTTATPRKLTSRATTTPGLQDSVWDAETPDVSLGVFVSPMTSTAKKPRLLTPGRIRSILGFEGGSSPSTSSAASDAASGSCGPAGALRGVRTPVGGRKGRASVDLRGVRRVVGTPRVLRTPAADYQDVRGMKAMFGTPVVQNSAVPDYGNVGGVKAMFRTPRAQQATPAADYTNVNGVKKMFATPVAQQPSPVADYSEVGGLRNLMSPPTAPQSPPADYVSNIGGVKKLLTTPRAVASTPPADYSRVSGVEQLFSTPLQSPQLLWPDDDVPSSPVVGSKRPASSAVQRSSVKKRRAMAAKVTVDLGRRIRARSGGACSSPVKTASPSPTKPSVVSAKTPEKQATSKTTKGRRIVVDSPNKHNSPNLKNEVAEVMPKPKRGRPSKESSTKATPKPRRGRNAVVDSSANLTNVEPEVAALAIKGAAVKPGKVAKRKGKPATLTVSPAVKTLTPKSKRVKVISTNVSEEHAEPKTARGKKVAVQSPVQQGSPKTKDNVAEVTPKRKRGRSFKEASAKKTPKPRRGRKAVVSPTNLANTQPEAATLPVKDSPVEAKTVVARRGRPAVLSVSPAVKKMSPKGKRAKVVKTPEKQAEPKSTRGKKLVVKSPAKPKDNVAEVTPKRKAGKPSKESSAKKTPKPRRGRKAVVVSPTNLTNAEPDAIALPVNDAAVKPGKAVAHRDRPAVLSVSPAVKKRTPKGKLSKVVKSPEKQADPKIARGRKAAVRSPSKPGSHKRKDIVAEVTPKHKAGRPSKEASAKKTPKPRRGRKAVVDAPTNQTEPEAAALPVKDAALKPGKVVARRGRQVVLAVSPAVKKFTPKGKRIKAVSTKSQEKPVAPKTTRGKPATLTVSPVIKKSTPKGKRGKMVTNETQEKQAAPKSTRARKVVLESPAKQGPPNSKKVAEVTPKRKRGRAASVSSPVVQPKSKRGKGAIKETAAAQSPVKSADTKMVAPVLVKSPVVEEVPLVSNRRKTKLAEAKLATPKSKAGRAATAPLPVEHVPPKPKRGKAAASEAPVVKRAPTKSRRGGIVASPVKQTTPKPKKAVRSTAARQATPKPKRVVSFQTEGRRKEVGGSPGAPRQRTTRSRR